MPIDDPVFSPENFYRNGSSIWRWVKYGHGNSTSFVSPFAKDSLEARGAARIDNRIKILMLNPEKMPPIFRSRAANFAKAAEHFPASPGSFHNYPGDGYTFFMDPCFFGYRYPRHTDPVVFRFYNYLYSYRHLISPPLFNFLVRLNGNIAKIKIFYEHRSSIFKDTSCFDRYNTLGREINCQKKIEFAFLSRLFGHSLNKAADKLNIPPVRLLSLVYTLFEGFTVSAARRILFNSQATNQSITRSANLVDDTKSLVDGPLPQTFHSIAALQAFHDNEMQHTFCWARVHVIELKREYIWPHKLVELVNSVSEGKWHIPLSPIELIERGKEHRNCVGSYFGRHFNEPKKNKKRFSKTLILFSDVAEAEIILYFADKSTDENGTKTVCIVSKVIQCKTRYNNVYPGDIPSRLSEAFKGCDINLFAPSRADTQQES